MASGFKTPLDVAKHACIILGVREITSFTDTNSVASKVFNTLYDKLRGRELERNWWKFSIRRSISRPVGDTTFLWTPPTYSGATNYSQGAIVAYVPTIIPGASETVYWQADADVASGGTAPDVNTHWHRYVGPLDGAPFSISTSYYTGEIVSSGGAYYLSLTSSNTDVPPSSKWRALNGTAATIKILYPLGAGPAWDTQTMNVYRLPYGFDRTAPRYLFDNDIPFLGADVGPYADDLNLEGNYFVTELATPVLLRFSADVMDVYDMAGMFCVGLAAEMAWHGCERITQSAEKKAEAKAAYEEAMLEARLINAFLTGDKKQPTSLYIAVRV